MEIREIREVRRNKSMTSEEVVGGEGKGSGSEGRGG